MIPLHNLKKAVIILVLLEDTLRVNHETAEVYKACTCHNPCFIGRYSQSDVF